jgi:biotin transport system substrate-specific component
MTTKENAKNNILSKIVSRPHLADLLWIFSFSILTAVAAQITIPVEPVPFTLQTMMVLLSGAFLGAKNGAYSQVVYLGLGVLGFPVFAQVPDMTIGLARLFGPTGGYLLSFPVAAFLVGYLIEKNKSYINFVFSMFVANIFILLVGSLYLGIFFLGNIVKGLETGAALFLVWEVAKVFAAASIYFGVSKKYKKVF